MDKTILYFLVPQYCQRRNKQNTDRKYFIAPISLTFIIQKSQQETLTHVNVTADIE